MQGKLEVKQLPNRTTYVILSRSQILPVISEDSSTTVVNFCRTPSWYVPRVSTFVHYLASSLIPVVLCLIATNAGVAGDTMDVPSCTVRFKVTALYACGSSKFV